MCHRHDLYPESKQKGGYLPNDKILGERFIWSNTYRRIKIPTSYPLKLSAFCRDPALPDS